MWVVRSDEDGDGRTKMGTNPDRVGGRCGRHISMSRQHVGAVRFVPWGKGSMWMGSVGMWGDSHLWEVCNLLTVQVHPEPLNVDLHL